MKQRTAIVIGATGLVGRHVVELLLKDANYSCVKVFARRSLSIDHEKLQEERTDFDQLENISPKITGDVLFSCMGTTLHQAGSKASQYKIDFDYQYQFAKIACSNQVGKYILVSATSAHSKSVFFYPRIKGQLEEAINKLPFRQVVIVRPSILAGQRESERFWEKTSAKVINLFGKFIRALKKYRSITGAEVAQAMLQASNRTQQKQQTIFELDQLHQLAKEYNTSA